MKWRNDFSLRHGGPVRQRRLVAPITDTNNGLRRSADAGQAENTTQPDNAVAADVCGRRACDEQSMFADVFRLGPNSAEGNNGFFGRIRDDVAELPRGDEIRASFVAGLRVMMGRRGLLNRQMLTSDDRVLAGGLCVDNVLLECGDAAQ